MENLKTLQAETDSLRNKLKLKAKFNDFDKEFDQLSDQLKAKDKELFLLAKKEGVSINKFGRISL